MMKISEGIVLKVEESNVEPDIAYQLRPWWLSSDTLGVGAFATPFGRFNRVYLNTYQYTDTGTA